MNNNTNAHTETGANQCEFMTRKNGRCIKDAKYVHGAFGRGDDEIERCTTHTSFAFRSPEFRI